MHWTIGVRLLTSESIFSPIHDFLTGTWDKTALCLLDSVGGFPTCQIALVVVQRLRTQHHGLIVN